MLTLWIEWMDTFQFTHFSSVMRIGGVRYDVIRQDEPIISGRAGKVTHDLLSSKAMVIILARISGGRTSRLHDFLLVKTFLPIWKLTEDESPCRALVMPSPDHQHKMQRVDLTYICTGSDDMRQQERNEHCHGVQVNYNRYTKDDDEGDKWMVKNRQE